MPIRSTRRFIGITDVKPGMMVQFNYSKKGGGSGSYIVLVVDPRRENDHATEPQLHGFIIGELSDTQLIEFFNSFGKTVSLDSVEQRASVIEGLNTDEAYAKFSTSKYVKNRAYRTFNLSGISQMRQILLGNVDK
jgi:hypothetical protein